MQEEVTQRTVALCVEATKLSAGMLQQGMKKVLDEMQKGVTGHILDEDRKINAQKFESAFYANPDLRSVRPPEEPKEPAPATLDLESLVEQLRNSPELANTLAALLASAPSEK